MTFIFGISLKSQVYEVLILFENLKIIELTLKTEHFFSEI